MASVAACADHFDWSMLAGESKHNSGDLEVVVTKRVGRRGFAKSLGVTAALAPVLLGADAVAARALQNVGTGAATDQFEGPVLTAQQERKLADAIARRPLQLARLHEQALSYDLEPAFVFRVRVAPHSGRKP